MVLMDIETYNRREEDLALAQRLSAIELARLSGTYVFVDDIQDCRQDDDKNLL